MPLIEAWEAKNPEEPNTLYHTHEFDYIKVDEDFCKLLTKEMFKIYIVRVEDSKIMQEIT